MKARWHALWPRVQNTLISRLPKKMSHLIVKTLCNRPERWADHLRKAFRGDSRLGTPGRIRTCGLLLRSKEGVFTRGGLPMPLATFGPNLLSDFNCLRAVFRGGRWRGDLRGCGGRGSRFAVGAEAVGWPRWQVRLQGRSVGRPSRHAAGARATRAAKYLTVSRHVALSLQRRETTAKAGIAMKRPMAGQDNGCLLEVLGVGMRLPCRLPPDLDSTRARCYKSKHPTAES